MNVAKNNRANRCLLPLTRMAHTELDLVNKVELRIALAANDVQLQKCLNIYLSPVILKLSSPDAAVKQIVFKIMQNILTRLGPSKDIKLPADALMEQVKNPKVPVGSDSLDVRLYSLLFISKAVDRMDSFERRKFLPKIIHGINNYPQIIKARLFHILCKTLIDWKTPEFESAQYQELVNDLALETQDELFLSKTIAKFFMLTANNSLEALPGLSVYDVSFFTKDAGISYKSGHDILLVKQNLLEFLKAGFKSASLALPLLIASVDTSSSISNQSELLYRKLNFNLEDPDFIDELIRLFIGDEDKHIPPSLPAVQLKVLSQLNKSVVACKNPRISQVANKGLFHDIPRLKQETVQLVRWINSHTIINDSTVQINETIKQFNTDMANTLKESIMVLGWPQMHLNNGGLSSQQITQVLQQYETLSEILKATPSLFLNDISYIDFFFESLEKGPVDIRISIQEGLSKLTPFLSELSADCKQQLKQIAWRYLNMNETENTLNIQSCRFVALKFINCSFSFDDVEARFLNIISTAKFNRPEIIEEATKGLHPHWFNISQSSNTIKFKSTSELLGHGNIVNFPQFEHLVLFISNQCKDSDSKIFQCMDEAIRFCVQTLVANSIKGQNTVIVDDEDWDIRLEKALEVDSKVRSLVKSKIMNISSDDTELANPNAFSIFMILLIDAIDKTVSIKTLSTYEGTFLKILSLASSDAVGGLISSLSLLIKIFNDEKSTNRTIIELAKIIGIIASHPMNTDEYVSNLLHELVFKTLDTRKPNSLLLAGILYSRLSYRNRINVIDENTFKAYLESLLDGLKQSKIYPYALEAIGELSIYNLLASPLKLVSENYVKHVFDIIKTNAKRFDEKSILVLSYLSLVSNKSITDEIQLLIYETHMSKQTEFLFTSGEAFLILACGWDSKALARTIDINDGKVKFLDTSDKITPILNTVLLACTNTKPSLRRAACIWLLSLVDFCSSSPVIKNNSSKIHLAFMKFLADRDELVQEAASRGLSLIYELGDFELKDIMVKGLLRSFTDNNSTNSLLSGTIEDDTELFDKDILKTNDGSVSTYRDVLNLATDIGDPSLVYKFISLAKSSALWSSRKGMAFGLGSILSKTSLDDMLAKNKGLSQRLIPKLYRYKYDPNTNISNSMEDIWNVLVEDSARTVKEHFSDILQELLNSMGSKEWRVREASTTAMCDLLNIVEFSVFENKIEEIWNMSFRVLDDIKESVRKQANKLTKQLANILIKSGKTSDVGLSKVMPFLLGNKGILSDADDVRSFALETILKLIKSDSSSIKPFVPLLLETFVGLMSTLEPEIINYLILNADKYNIKGNEIDAKRLQSLGNSPIMEAVESMIDIIDNDIIDNSVNSIINAMTKSIGLPSKVSASRILVSLVTKKYELLKPYGDKLMKLAINQLKDNNDTVASSFSISVAYLSRLSNLDAVVKYGNYLKKLYFSSEDERGRLISSIANENFAKYSPEKYEKASSLFVPLCFIGTNDIDEEVSKIFEKEWIENTSGSNVIKFYLPEIIDLMSQYITSPNFQMRRTLAKSIVRITNDITDFSNISDSLISQIFDILISNCKGKSWAGKELIFEALVNFTIKLKAKAPIDQIDSVVLTEGKRKNKEYQKHAIKTMGKYLHEFPNDEMIHVYVSIMDQIINGDFNSDDEDDMDIDSSSRPMKKANNSQLEEKSLEYIVNVFDTFTKSKLNSQLFYFMLSNALKLLNNEYDFEFTWRSKVAINDCFGKTLGELYGIEFEVQRLFDLWDKLREVCCNFNNIENVKIKFIRNSKMFIQYLEEFHLYDKVEILNKCLNEFNEDSTTIRGELKKN